MPLPLFAEKKTKVKNIVAIAAGKGGVGKSSVTVNLALALQQKGYSVGVMDVDIYGPSVRKMLPEDSMPAQKGEKIQPALSGGIKVISYAYFRDEGEASAVRAPIANGIVTQFIERIDWGNLDYLLIDFPPGTGDVQLTICQKLNLTGAIIVTTPQEVSLLDVRKAMNLFEQVNIPIIGIIENMSYFEHLGEKLYLFGKGGGEKLAGEKGAVFLGQIPIDPLICECGDKGESLFVKDTPSSLVFHRIADEAIKNLATSENDKVNLQWLDDHSFSIKWDDGISQKFHLHTLQKNCPCAGCVDESTGKRRDLPSDEKVKALNIQNVGRYAIKIKFSTGCSSGIYHFEDLKKLGNVHV